MLLNKYLENQKFPKKIIYALVDENFINSNPSYYTYYPFLFHKAFRVNDKDILETLTLAGFFYYKGIISIDDIFDQKAPENVFNKYVIANVCQEETIKLLSSLFPKTHPFWELWNLRKIEYIKAYDMDRNPEKIINHEQFETLADYKCAFGKIAIDSLFHLSTSKNENLYKKILASHKFFYVGFQLIDDITDFIEDMENEQFNILHFELKKLKNKAVIEKEGLKDLKTEMYLNGTINKVQEMAIKNLEKSLSFVNDIALDQWKQEVQGLYNTAISQYLNTSAYVSVFETKQILATEVIKHNNLKIAITKSIDFINKSQQKDGSWNDYFNEAGVSNSWTTAFMLTYYSKDITIDQTNILNHAIEFLKKTRGSNKLWGYNSSWIPDADSTSFVMLSSLNHKNAIDPQTIANWLTYQNEDGGFSTYNNPKEVLISLNSTAIQNVEGWTQSHFCVSATAYYVLSKLAIKNDALHKLRTYLIQKIKQEKSIHSYWWTDAIYAITFLVKGAEIYKDTELLTICNQFIDNYLQEKKELNYFYQGLLLDCICSSEHLFKIYENEAHKIVIALLQNQFSDGSWKESYALRIPEPSVKSPENQNILWTKADQGTNILVNDYHRLFTTVVCLSGLSKYIKVKNETEKQIVLHG
ncbi:prenyltransferase/squalene oxidase repeat-containing protein [Tenacibaculum agarivorans]|uniref:terpene cyclase/mutase family protein n=1 Tax=Tenacibaculum agarivorans TaxID=1908389 RepID=UPI00094BB7CE|nr:terpene cyclase/mutase family protein [Tenacibaculum agarivorans]